MSQTNSLQGQVALVTGASSGIGAGVAIALAEAGAKVVVNYAHSAKGAAETVSKIFSLGGEAISVQADVSQEAQVKAMFLQAIATYGTVDILVNNAGLQQDFSLVDMSLEAWNKVIDINLTRKRFAIALRSRVKLGNYPQRGMVVAHRCSGMILCRQKNQLSNIDQI